MPRPQKNIAVRVEEVLRRQSQLLTPEQNLIFAVINQAVHDYLTGRGGHAAQADARRFIHSDRLVELAVCIDLDAHFVRDTCRDAKNWVSGHRAKEFGLAA